MLLCTSRPTQVMGAPYIAPTLGVCGTSSVQPFFSGGTVEGLVFEGAWTGVPIEMPTVLQMSLDAMRGLQVLHEAPGGPIIHNAIRPEQLLRYANGTKKLLACTKVVIFRIGCTVLGRDRFILGSTHCIADVQSVQAPPMRAFVVAT